MSFTLNLKTDNWTNPREVAWGEKGWNIAEKAALATPMEAMPGKLDLYPYHEVSIMPQLADIEANTPFSIFMNPKRIQHGDRKGIEIKKFDQTTESMQYGELFLWFRKRDGFLVILTLAMEIIGVF